jgi:hypothetical protein
VVGREGEIKILKCTFCDKESTKIIVTFKANPNVPQRSIQNKEYPLCDFHADLCMPNYGGYYKTPIDILEGR